MARVGGPSIVSALFAISMDGKVLGGRLWWLFMVVMSAANFVSTLFVEEPHALNGLPSIDEEEEPVDDESWGNDERGSQRV